MLIGCPLTLIACPWDVKRFQASSRLLGLASDEVKAHVFFKECSIEFPSLALSVAVKLPHSSNDG